MKSRYSFVSNSSSSSFVVIGRGVKRNKLPIFDDSIRSGKLVVKDVGTSEFGWGPEKINDVESKIIFAYLQYLYVADQHPEWLEMLEFVIKDYLKIKEIDWQITLGYNDSSAFRHGYIDHQSNSSEGVNTEIFDSEEDLVNFLFDDASYIQLDNDNY